MPINCKSVMRLRTRLIPSVPWAKPHPDSIRYRIAMQPPEITTCGRQEHTGTSPMSQRGRMFRSLLIRYQTTETLRLLYNIRKTLAYITTVVMLAPIAAIAAPPRFPSHAKHVHGNPQALPYRFPGNAGATVLSKAQIENLYATPVASGDVVIVGVHLTNWRAHKSAYRQGISEHDISPDRIVYEVTMKFPRGYHANGEIRGADSSGLAVLDAADGRLLSFYLKGTDLNPRHGRI